jgi:hypothetical protein
MESLTGSSVVEELWDVEATIHFTGTDSLRRAMDATFFKNRDWLSDHTILVTGFKAERLLTKDDDDEEDFLIPRHSKVLYLKNLSLLVITMPSSPHQTASLLFYRLLDRKLQPMNCADEIVPGGAPLMEMEDVKKSPDASWRPTGKMNITFAIEAGVTESRRSLGADAKIWLEHLGSHVTQVLTINIFRTRPEIIFGLWVQTKHERHKRTGHPPRASKAQEVSVVVEGGQPVAEGDLCISIEKLFDRRRRPGTAERDIVISKRELGGVAREVWFLMGFT